MAALLRLDPTFRGYTLAGFVLGEGRDLTVTDSVGVGIQGNDGSSADEGRAVCTSSATPVPATAAS